MQVNINSDSHVDVKENSVQQWRTEITAALKRFGDWITRVEVQLTNENSRAKGGSDDIRCLMEARPAGRQPVSIEVRAASINQAIREGIDTLERRLENVSEKARNQARKRQ